VAVTHISRVNCGQITGDRPRQPANEIFSTNQLMKKTTAYRPSGLQEIQTYTTFSNIANSSSSILRLGMKKVAHLTCI